ncbi:hypothetical protein I3F58_25310 [Streptomyces sp. MUM 203J]|nr:hypothetical protein [Streptomyces sp. MUM 203J]
MRRPRRTEKGVAAVEHPGHGPGHVLVGRRHEPAAAAEATAEFLVAAAGAFVTPSGVKNEVRVSWAAGHASRTP